MLRNFFLIGLRNLQKQKGYSIVKIAGLAMGLATSIVIYLYVLEDLSYERKSVLMLLRFGGNNST